MYNYQRTRALAALKSGDMKKVTAAANSIRYHKIKSGDTLGSISRKYHVSIDKLCSLNGIKRTTVLRIGQVLRCS